MASRPNRAVRMRTGVQNEFAEPCEPPEIKLKASLGLRLARMESYHPQAIYHRPAGVRSGLASPQRAEMDLQNPCQARSGGLIEARSGAVSKLVKWVQQQRPPSGGLLFLSCSRGGPPMMARIGVVKALNRHVERVFNPERKDTHWGKRKLKRDQ